MASAPLGLYERRRRALFLRRLVAGAWCSVTRRAAVLAALDGTALSNFAAAAFWTFIPWRERRVEVTIPGSGTRRIAGVRVHRSRSLEPRDVLTRGGIRVTSPARTLLDLAAALPERALRRAARQAQALRLVSV